MKRVFISIFITFSLLNINAIDNKKTPYIGVTTPFVRNTTAETLLYQKHFTFELLFSYDTDSEDFFLELANVNDKETEFEYIRECKKSVVQNSYDYLLYTTVYSTKKRLFFKVQLINPYNDEVIYNKLYNKEIDYTISEFLTEVSRETLEKLKSIKLEKIRVKKVDKEEDDEKENTEADYDVYNTRFEHEVFVMNSFFKCHANIASFVEVYTGYNFSPFNFFSIEGGIFLGGGFIDKVLDYNNIAFDKFFVGWAAGFKFFLPNIVSPSIGLRFEINYISEDHFYFTIPLDLGLKFNILKKSSIRFNTSFQFISLDITKAYEQTRDNIPANNWWNTDIIIGFMIGYARKI